MATESSEPCKDCAGTGWLIVGRAGVTGAKRCACMPPIAARPVPPERAEPVLSADEISLAVEGLSSIPWFPKEEGARTMIADAVARLCSSGPACFELVRVMIDRYRQWPGVHEMRICYCALIGSPLSGDDLRTKVSEFYPDGFGRSLPSVGRAALPPGHVATVDAAFDRSVRLLSAAKDLDRVKRARAAAPEAPTNPNFKPVTQADIDAAVNELRDKRARAELGQ